MIIERFKIGLVELTEKMMDLYKSVDFFEVMWYNFTIYSHFNIIEIIILKRMCQFGASNTAS